MKDKENKKSVCIATFNGSKYVRYQIESILPQLSEDDEIIISDNLSTDDTIEIINNINDPRIKIYTCQEKGVVKNFENAIKHATGKIIFLSDQDDIWKENKVESIISTFKSNPKITLIFSNAEYLSDNVDQNESLFFPLPPSLGLFSNILKNNFLGCTISFKRDIDNKIFPFPRNLAMHDWWIGLSHIIYGKVVFLNEALILYRRHSNNVTTGNRSSIITGIKWRVNIVKELVLRWIR